jgi:oligopeptidase B
MTTPSTVFETDMATKETETLKQQEVLGGTFDPANYQSERVMVEARDGTQVPRFHRVPQGHRKKRQQPLPAIRIRQLRLQHGRWILEHAF